MQNKKLAKILAVSLLAACGITACDDVEARPNVKNDDAPLLSFVDDVFGNSYESINDTFHSEVASKTLDEILYIYAINTVGPYNATIAKTYASKVTSNGEAINASDLVTLEDVIGDSSKLTKFVEQHPAYNVGDKAIDLVTARYNAMTDAVAEQMFSKISGASENNKFNERTLLVSLYSAGSKVANPYNISDADLTVDMLITPSIDHKDVFTDEIMHKEFYSSATNTYIEDEILPNIYKDALVQQYIFDVQAKSLGSSSARKINYVAIKYDDLDESLYAEKLVKAFTTKWLLTANNTDTEASFDTLSSIWNGEFMKENNPQSDENKMLTALGLDLNAMGLVETSKDGLSYIKGSAYGDLVEDYAKVDPNPAKSKASRDYTGGNKYVKEIGFDLESDKIKLNDHTNGGWAIKSSSVVSSLPDSIKNRLFNLSVATGINSGTAAAITTTDGIKIGSTNKYVAKFNDHFFLRNSKLKSNQDEYESIIFHDTGSHTYYIVEVEAAVSTNYMAEDAKDNYALRIDVASLLSTNDANVTLSKKHWIEKCEIEYHDQSVYDYFASNFPELFEDD